MKDIIELLQQERYNRALVDNGFSTKLIKDNSARIKDLIIDLIFESKYLGIGSLFVKKDKDKSKEHFFQMAKLIEYDILNFNSRIFDYDIYNVSFAFLSDNVDYLRNTFANLGYKGDGKNYPDMDMMVQQGESCIYIHSMLQILKQDWEMLARNITIMEQKVINKKKNALFIPDYEFCKAVLNQNKAQAEGAIYKLLEPKNHKKRNDDYIINQLLSMPALGYAKLAWLSGIEVEIDSPLVPKELLPIWPNESYDDLYDFLRDSKV